MTTACWRTFEGYSDTTMTGDTVHAVAAEYPHSALEGTQTCSSHSGTELYDTYVASQEESGCVLCDHVNTHDAKPNVI